MKDIWMFKYKPKTIDDLILPLTLKERFKTEITDNSFQSKGFFSEKPGTGKSSTAFAIAEFAKSEGSEVLWINASLEKGVDVLRNKIQKFVQTTSLEGKLKLVILDEFDNFTRDGQAAFRGFLDDYQKKARFIMTGNYKGKIIQPLLDRLEILNFDDICSKNKQELVPLIYEKLCLILEKEKICFNADDVKDLIKQKYPSFRLMIKELQIQSQGGDFVPKVVLETTEFEDILKEKDYQKLIKKINTLENPNGFYDWCYENSKDLINQIPILAQHQYQAQFAVNPYLNLASCVIRLKTGN